MILKHLYDCDIVEEEAMLMWAGEQGRSEFTPPALSDEQVAALRAKATPFVTWLEEADEEDEDDDDVEEEVCHTYHMMVAVCFRLSSFV